MFILPLLSIFASSSLFAMERALKAIINSRVMRDAITIENCIIDYNDWEIAQQFSTMEKTELIKLFSPNTEKKEVAKPFLELVKHNKLLSIKAVVTSIDIDNDLDVKFLINSANGWNVLHYIVSNNQSDILTIMFNHKQTFDLLVTKRNNAGKSPLEMAAEKGFDSLFLNRNLLYSNSSQMKIDFKRPLNQSGQNALMILAENDHDEILKGLLEDPIILRLARKYCDINGNKLGEYLIHKPALRELFERQLSKL